MIKRFWNWCKQDLVTPYSILAWILNPDPKVMADVRKRFTQDHKDVCEKLILLHCHDDGPNESENKRTHADTLRRFWDEYSDFTSKSGKIFSLAEREHIWSPDNVDLKNGDAHLWHYNNSYLGTDHLGRMACLVCSKVLGIGLAERSWGDTKQLKSGKRSNLDDNATKQLSTIYGSHQINIAKIHEEELRKNPFDNKDEFWNEADFECLELERFGINVDELVKKNRRMFKAWKEDWEDKRMLDNLTLTKKKFETKYLGLRFYDEVLKVHFTTDHMFFQTRQSRKYSKGWHVIGVPDNMDESLPEDEKDGMLEKFSLDDELLYKPIIKYYKENPDKYLTIVTPDEGGSDREPESDELQQDSGDGSDESSESEDDN
jgi:hypothetical protein